MTLGRISLKSFVISLSLAIVVFHLLWNQLQPSPLELETAVNARSPGTEFPGRRLHIALIHDIIPSGKSGSEHRLITIASELQVLHHEVWMIGRETQNDENREGEAMLDKLGIRHLSGLRHFDRIRFEGFLARRKFDVIVYCMWFWIPQHLYMSVPSMFLPRIQNVTSLRPLPLHVILSDDAHSHRELLLSPLRPNDGSRRPDEASPRESIQLALAIREHEVAMFARADAVIAITEEDADRIRSLPILSSRIPPISVVPFVQRPFVSTTPSSVLAPFEIRTGFSFVGPVVNPTNGLSMRHFFVDTWTALSSALPHTTLTIYGGNDFPFGHTWRSLLNLTVPDERLRTRVRLVGYQESLHEALNQTRVFLAPIYASTGIITKILDAWRHGVPTVTSPFGLQGYNLTKDGKDEKGNQIVLVATTPHELVKHCVSLYTDEKIWNLVSKNCLEYSRKFGPNLLTRSVRGMLALWTNLLDPVQTSEL